MRLQRRSARCLDRLPVSRSRQRAIRRRTDPGSTREALSSRCPAARAASVSNSPKKLRSGLRRTPRHSPICAEQWQARAQPKAGRRCQLSRYGPDVCAAGRSQAINHNRSIRSRPALNAVMRWAGRGRCIRVSWCPPDPRSMARSCCRMPTSLPSCNRVVRCFARTPMTWRVRVTHRKSVQTMMGTPAAATTFVS